MKMKRITRNVGLSAILILSFLAFAVAPVAAQDIAGSRTISDATVAPGDTFTVTVDVGITGTVYGPVLDEDVPTGWTVTEGADDGGIYHAADTSWLWGGSQNTDKTVIYTVTVPATAADGSYDLTGTVLATAAGPTTIGPFGVTGDNSVTVESVAAGTIAGSRTISDATVAPGDTFTVTVDVGITGTVYGPVLDEDVPTGWTVTEGADDGGIYHAADTSWLWGGSQNTDKTVIYTVTVPATAADGSYDLTGTVLATAAGPTTIGPFDVTGDETVIVSSAEPDLIVETITVLPATADLTVGDTQTFTATAYDQYDAPMAGIVITWTNTTPAVGTVDPVTATTGVDGTATTAFAAVAEGATTVAATNGDVHDTAAVTVLEVGDVNGDGAVNVLDMVLIGQHWGETGTPGWIPEDVKEDGVINVLDMVLVGQHWTG